MLRLVCLAALRKRTWFSVCLTLCTVRLICGVVEVELYALLQWWEEPAGTSYYGLA
jgi:hypothetical protein